MRRVLTFIGALACVAALSTPWLGAQTATPKPAPRPSPTAQPKPAASSQAKPPAPAEAPNPRGWPREAKAAAGTVVMYQPQLEKVTDNLVEARAAVQVSQPGKPPVFGAVWITARVNIDREARLVTLRDIRIPRVRFVDATDTEKSNVAAFLEQQMPTWDLDMDLDEFIPLMELAEHAAPVEAGLKHDPPRIIVAAEPTTLVVLDGPARRKPMTEPAAAAQEKLERVVNTPAFIVFHPGTKQFFLAAGGDLWYAAPDATGPYTASTTVPAAVTGLVPKANPADVSKGLPPKVIVSTEPAEVIVMAGKPSYVPIGDMNVLALSNTDTVVLVDMKTRAHYVVLSGRWYKSTNEMSGPWTFVPPVDLPADFSKVPANSNYASVRTHVPGTVEAQEALLDNLIPETQAIRRNDASLTVTYDGVPKFENVENVASLQYAVNTPQSVFKFGNRYFACDEAVWYESSSATGPWAVATSIPVEIYNIPTSNPHYNVTYVRVYDVTPDVVYVGYTPGYLWSFPYGGCVVYGTGWYYPGWYGAAYYPRPYTYGFRVGYNPYYGWGVGIGWSSGPVTVSIGFGMPFWGAAWWGPWGYRPYYPMYRPPYYAGYRPPYYPGYRPGGYPGYRPPVGGVGGVGGIGSGRPGTPAQLPAGARGGNATPGNSIYNRAGNTTRNAAGSAGVADRSRVGSPTTRPNNVYSSQTGDVFRRSSSGGWEQRQGGAWSPSSGSGGAATRPSTPTTRPTTPTTSRPTTTTRPTTSTGGLNRDYAARQRGTVRSSGAARSGARAGGGRRGH